MHLPHMILCITISIAVFAEEELLFDHLCRSNYSNREMMSRKSCECITESNSQIGTPIMRIDCSFIGLKSTDIQTDLLPLNTESFDLSWNLLNYIPSFSSDSLTLLNVMHNNISEITEKNFIRLTALRELYVNWNAVHAISINAFAELKHLRKLDLSHNNIKYLGINTFYHLTSLTMLDLSWNRQLNVTTGIEDVYFFAQFGAQSKLTTLKLEQCGLSSIHLPEESHLITLSLRGNQFQTVPSELPANLKEFDMSNNPMPAFADPDTVMISQLNILLLEGMPILKSIEKDAFSHLEKLKILSLQNSRELTYFNEYAFGEDGPPAALQSLNLRGTNIHTFNQTILPIFQKLSELDLNGVPLRCDCELAWIKELKLETNGRCITPSNLRGLKLTNVKKSDFSCPRWPRWVYGLLILVILILCAAGIALIVIGLRPYRGVTMRRKVGSSSPYARVTIEPNRQENGCY